MGCFMDHSGYGFSQWETTLQCTVVSHWLSHCPEFSLCLLLELMVWHIKTVRNNQPIRGLLNKCASWHGATAHIYILQLMYKNYFQSSEILMIKRENQAALRKSITSNKNLETFYLKTTISMKMKNIRWLKYARTVDETCSVQLCSNIKHVSSK